MFTQILFQCAQQKYTKRKKTGKSVRQAAVQRARVCYAAAAAAAAGWKCCTACINNKRQACSLTHTHTHTQRHYAHFASAPNWGVMWHSGAASDSRGQEGKAGALPGDGSQPGSKFILLSQAHRQLVGCRFPLSPLPPSLSSSFACCLCRWLTV